MTSTRLADLLGGVVRRIHIPEEIAERIAERLQDSQSESEQTRRQSVARLTQRRQALQATMDRSYEEYLEGRISAAFWTRKSGEWEAESATVDAEIARLGRPTPSIVATGEKILELAKQAENLNETGDWRGRRDSGPLGARA